MINRALQYLLLLSIIFCCDKGINKRLDKNAIILFHGNPAVDGCGWLIKYDNELLHPTNLSSNFFTDSLKVLIDYKPLNTYFTCGWRDPGYQNIELINIIKQ